MKLNQYIDFQLAIKRVLDLFIGTILLMFTLPLLAVTALVIKLDSKGPVIFRQMRLGKDRKSFTCYKFRSMYVGSSDQLHKDYIKKLMTEGPLSRNEGRKVFKITEDSRLTPVGRLIRRLSIDELPQLFNVLKGQMSMVGPRPAIPYELQYHDDTMLERFSVKPGLTGLWQISGRSKLGYREMVILDIYYVNYWSILLDIKIILKTIPYVLRMSRAY